MYLLCYVDKAVPGEHILPRDAWKHVNLNCWANRLWILGKENDFLSDISQVLEEEPRNFHS